MGNEATKLKSKLDEDVGDVKMELQHVEEIVGAHATSIENNIKKKKRRIANVANQEGNKLKRKLKGSSLTHATALPSAMIQHTAIPASDYAVDKGIEEITGYDLEQIVEDEIEEEENSVGTKIKKVKKLAEGTVLLVFALLLLLFYEGWEHKGALGRGVVSVGRSAVNTAVKATPGLNLL